MAAVNLAVSGNGAASPGSISYSGGSANYTNLNDSSDSTTMSLSGDINAAALFPMEALPSDFDLALSATVNFRMRESTKGDISELDYVQIFQADGVTALTPASSGSSSSTMTSYTFTPGTLYATSKAAWEGCKVKIKNKIGEAATVWAELSVDINYQVVAVGPGTEPNSGDFFLIMF